jgi:tetratricopeptide (TPR) repeat protein
MDVLDRLDDAQFDDATLCAWQASERPLARLFAAAALVRLGRAREARAELAALSSNGDPPARVLVAAGALSFELGDFSESLACLDRVVRRAAAVAQDRPAGSDRHPPRLEAAGRRPPLSDALQMKFSLATALGWRREGIEAAERLIAAEPSQAAAIHAELQRLLGSEGNAADAFLHVQAREALEPDSAEREWDAAQLLCRLERFEEARARVERALQLAEDVPETHLRAARTLIECGAFAAAEDQVRTALRLDRDCRDAYVLIGELRLWHGDAAAALSAAAQTLGCDARCAVAHRQRGAALLLQAHYREALAALDTALVCDPSDREAPLFRAEALLGLSRFDEAIGQLEAHPMHGSSEHWVLELLLGLIRLERPTESGIATRLMAMLRRLCGMREPARTDFLSYYELNSALRALDADADAILARGERADVSALLRQVLAALRGNRNPNPTYYDAGRQALAPVPVRSPRAASLRALGLIKTAPPDTVLQRLTAVMEEYPDSSLPRAYRAELQLWLGEYEAARCDLEAAIAQHAKTRWAYYGLASLANVEGNPSGALASCERSIEALGSEAPAIHVHRGEALRRLGRTDDAIRELRRACDLNRNRLSGHLNLALAGGDAGDAGAQAAGYRWLRAQAPGLVSDAGFGLGIREWDDDDALSVDAIRALLERMLLMMRGNRASSITTWVSSDGFVRFARAAATGHSAMDRLRADAPKRWAILRRLLEAALSAEN